MDIVPCMCVAGGKDTWSSSSPQSCPGGMQAVVLTGACTYL